ncbi:PREDICTED: RNA polymerase II-associated protein 3 [Chinchilla lanigera]|uniref:RNA polymerase II-associated protein 3 n=1 Tax=Chinchilla lanigera TaxID=34839 RepID=UPI0006983C66|nr:PREDICTED: RNA polymerase II-associated protein 3 [Chinchilla lanigera]
MAYLKIEKYEEAERDCTQAISLDGSYSKAFARRGTARTFLGKINEARQDFETVLLLEPGNKQAVTELSKIKKELIEKGHWDDVFLDSTQRHNVVKPIDNPLPLGSTKPLKKVIIEETGNLIQTVDVPDSTTAAAPESNPITLANVIAAAGLASKKNSSQGDLLPSSDTPRAKVLKTEEISDTSALQPQVSLKQGGYPSPSEISRKVEQTPAQLVTSVLPPTPANSFQLESDFRQLKSSPDMLYQYLKQIEPSVYPKLFQKNLDPDVFNQIMRILHDFYME